VVAVAGAVAGARGGLVGVAGGVGVGRLGSGVLVGVVVVVVVREVRGGVVVTAGGQGGRVVPWSGLAGVSAVGVELVDGSLVVLDFTAGVRRARVERVAAGLDAALRGAVASA
jgi:hypothetical protein